MCLVRHDPDGGCKGFFRIFPKKRVEMAGKPSPPPIYHLRPSIQPICPTRSPGALAGTGASELALMDRPGEGRGIAYPARPELAPKGLFLPRQGEDLSLTRNIGSYARVE